MNFVNFKIVKSCTKSFVILTFLALPFATQAWEVDFSRRQVDFSSVQNTDRLPASVNEEKSLNIFSPAFDVAEPTQDIVIMNTDKGFVPDTVRLRKNGNYKVHVININQKEKNVSFVLDAFAEHHNTIFGEAKVFSVNPKVDGIFTFQCPETAVQGKMVIYSNVDDKKSERKPASK